jgi:hypothetical protein
MSFFRQFPLTTYDLQKTGALMRITDLFRNVTAPQIKLDPTIAYTDYRVVDGARPDVVSQLLYGDPDYYWTFFIINDKLKSGHASWPMSHNQLDIYLTQEYDGYSVIQMSDNDNHYVTITTTSNAATTVATDAGGDLDFTSNPQYIINLATSSSRQVIKYDSYMQQIWIKNSGSSDTFLSTIQSAGTFRFSSYGSAPFTLSTLTIGSNTYDQFYPVSNTNGQKIASPGILPYVTLGRNAIHHYVFSPQIGDAVQLGYYQLDTNTGKNIFYGIKGAVTDMINADVNAYGGIEVDSGNGNIQYHYFTDPQGFLVTAQDVNKTVSSISSDSTFTISPSNRIVGVSYADWENDLNEKRSRIRVVNSTYIRAFVKQYRDLLNA